MSAGAPAAAARVAAQAKINLSLRILAREASGWHQLETLFLRVDVADLVTVQVGGTDRSLDVGTADLGPGERNLAWRAATAYQQATGWPSGFAIRLEKVIPVGAGLGGGSADAGAVLRALNALSPHPLPPAGLLGIAGLLGADVPFLTLEAPFALAWGRGQRLLELPPPPAREMLIVVPPFAIDTADAYGWLSPEGFADRIEPRTVRPAELGSWAALDRRAGNDFESVVAERHPVIHEITGALRAHGARIAQLTGSGSAIIGLFDTPPDLDGIAAAVEGSVIATRTAARVVGVDLME
jgi:4-diphosphocytidyl-2-C-methyl-D-erythritol kinase